MKKGFNERSAVWLLGVALSIGAILSALAARAFAAGTHQEAFPAPAEAVDALVAATRSGDTAELLKILGPESEKLISSGDPVADNTGRNRFVSAYDISHKLEGASGNKSVLHRR